MSLLSVNIFNEELLEDVEATFNVCIEDMQKAYMKIFEDSPIEEVSIIFVKSDYIRDLNKRYRDIDAPTDVLSFKLKDDMSQGEIYISPEFVYTTFKGEQFEEEILRLIIHGTLHILGYNHKESLNDSPDEEMFKVQEELLIKFKKSCT
jgi:probable rRNA maturation factor